MENRARELEQQLAEHLTVPAPAVYAFQQVSSTMDVAHALAAEGAPEGTLVWAKGQQQGRGRLGRTWNSPEGGVYLSLIVRPAKAASEIPQLSLVAGLAAAEAIRELTRLSPAIRWPNDVLVSSRKVCGILVESKNGAAVVGIGINVTTDPKELPETATSLAAAGASCDPYQLTGMLYGRFRTWYDQWLMGGFEPIRQALRAWMGLFGEVVRLTVGSADIEGTATDLDEGGRLLVRLDSGVVRAFDVGEVALLR